MASRRGDDSDYVKYLKYKQTVGAGGDWGAKKWAWVSQGTFGEEHFVQCEVLGEKGNNVRVRIGTDEQEVKKEKVEKMNPPKFDGVEDCAELGHLNEACVFHNLRLRYDVNIIYTYSGLFCVACNPYKRFPIYTDWMIKFYQGKRRMDVAPHVFAVADGAYRNMLEDRMNQSMLITGESGAGKTENTKKVIQYLAVIASQGGGEGTLEKQILEANPVLESFGNAKTLKNDNSSRFGKFIKVQFSSGGFISGASISSYLLEKSRVTWQAQGERNFHIFYQMISGSTAEEKKKYQLKDFKDYALLTGGCYKIDDMNDVEEWAHTKAAQTLLQYSDQENDSVFRTMSAILHLSNVQFAKAHGDASKVANPDALKLVADMLQSDPQMLDNGLVRPSIRAGVNEVIKKEMTEEQAAHSRDALCKSLYEKCFLWIIRKINKTLARERQPFYLGILDIAGFEIFKFNSFEQLLINYTNERLQQFFNNHMFKLEQEEYMREKINWSFINFGVDSQETIDLIHKKPSGILAVLDEETVFPKATDKTFITKLLTSQAKNPKIQKNMLKDMEFTVQHYAGQVTYDVNNWLEKNRDPLQDDLEKFLKASKDKWLVDLYSEEYAKKLERDPNADPEEGERKNFAAAKRTQARKKAAMFVSVSQHHKEGLQILMETLLSTYPHFIRCIIPNYRKAPGDLQAPIVLDQLRCNGVLEGIKISRMGFPNRIVYPEFVKRFYILIKGMPKNPADPKAATEHILLTLKIDKEQYRFGISKIFFRTGVLAHIEEIREKRIGQMILTMQAAARAFLARRVYKKNATKGDALRIIGKNVHDYLEFQKWLWWQMYQKVKPLLKGVPPDKALEEKEAAIKEMGFAITKEKDLRSSLEKQLKDLQKSADDLATELRDAEKKRKALESDKEEVERALSKLSAKCEGLEKEIEKNEGANKDVLDAKRALDAKVDQLNSQLSDVTAAKDALLAHGKEVQGELDKLKTDHANVTGDIAKLERQKGTLEGDVTRLRESVSLNEDNLMQLQKAIKALSSEYDENKNALDDTSSRHGILADTKAGLETDVAKVTSELDAEIAERADAQKTKDETEAKLTDVNAKLDAEQKKGQELAKEKKNLSNEIESLKEFLDDKDSNKSLVEKQKKKLESEMSELEDKASSTQGDIDRLQEDKRRLDGEFDDTRKKLDEALRKIQQLEARKAELQTELATLKDQLERETSSKQSLEKARKKLSEEHDALKAQLDTEQKERGNIQRAAKKLDEDIRQAKSDLERDSSGRESSEREMRRLESELATAKSNLSNVKDQLSIAEKKTSACELELQSLRDELDDVTVATKKSKAEIKTISDELDEFKDAFDANTDQRSAAEGKIRRIEADLQEARRQLEIELDLKNKAEAAKGPQELEVGELRNKVEAEEKLRQNAEKLCKKVERDIEDIQARVSSAQAELDKLNKSCKAKDAELKEAKRNFEFELQQIETQKKTSESALSQQLNDAKKQLEDAQAAVSNLERVKASMASDLAEVRDELEDLQGLKTKLEKTVRELKARDEVLKDQLEALESKDDIDAMRRRFNDDLDELKHRASVEADARARAEASVKSIETAVVGVKSQVEEMEKQKTKVQGDVKKYNTDLEELSRRGDEEATQRSKAEKAEKKLKKEIKDAKAALDATRGMVSEEEMRKINDQIFTMRTELDSIRSSKTGLERTAKDADRQLEELREQIDDEARSKAKLQADKRKLETDLESLRDAADEVEDLRDETESLRERHTAELDQLQNALMAATEAKNRAENERKAITADIQKISRAAEEDRRAREEVARAKKKLEDDMETLRTRFENTQKTVAKVQRDRNKKSNEVKDLMRKVQDGEVSKTEMQNATWKLSEELQQAQDQLESVKNEAIQAMAMKAELDSKVLALQDEIEDTLRAKNKVASTVKALNDELRDVRDMLDENEAMRSTLEANERKAQTDLEIQRKEVERERESLGQSEDAVSQADIEYRDVHTKADEAERAKASWDKEKKTLATDLDALRAAADAERRGRETADKKRKRIEKELKEARSQVAEAERKQKVAVDAVKRLEADVEKMRAAQDDMTAKAAVLEQEKHKLERNVGDAKTKTSRAEQDLEAAQAEYTKSLEDLRKYKKKVGGFFSKKD